MGSKMHSSFLSAVSVRGVVSTVVARRSYKAASEGRIVTTKITRNIIESYLNCTYEGHLKLVGQRGIQSDYGVLLAASRDAVRRLALDKISARHATDEIERDFALTLPALKRGAAFSLNGTLEDDHIALGHETE